MECRCAVSESRLVSRETDQAVFLNPIGILVSDRLLKFPDTVH